MAYYVEVDQDQLLKLADGLSVISYLQRSTGEDTLTLWLYGVTRDPAILDACKEAIAEYTDEEGITEETIQLPEVAIGLPVDIDGKAIHLLSGSGLRLSKGEVFVYKGAEGEGFREINFGWAHFAPTVNFSKLDHLCLANDESWLDRYLQQYGTKQSAEIQKQVTREVPATENAVPAGAGTPPAQEAPAAPQQKMTSARGPQLTDVLENWLG